MNIKEHFLLPGTWAYTSQFKAAKESLESWMRAEMRNNGYPTNACNDLNCNNPDLCATLEAYGCTTGGEGSADFDVTDTTSINLTYSSGTLTAASIIDPSGLNLLTVTGSGLLVSCEAAQDCIGAYLGGGQGLSYDDTDGSLSVDLSADAGNCLAFGTDDGLYFDCSGAFNSLNGISGTGSSGDEFRLGGALDRATTIDGGGVWPFSLVNSSLITLESEGGTPNRLSKLVLTDNPITGAQLTSQMTATQYSQLWLDPDATVTELRAVNSTNVGGISIAATTVSIGLDPGQGGRRFAVGATGHYLTNIDSVTSPHTLNALYIDTATDEIFHGDRFQTSEGSNGLTATTTLIKLGGTLTEDTEIIASGNDFEITNGPASLQLLPSALPGGSGEAARFYATDGTTVAEVGVYTGAADAPTVGSRAGTALLFNRVRHLPALDRLTLDAGLIANAFTYNVDLGSNIARMGYVNSGVVTGFQVDDVAVVGTPRVSLKNLPIYADNAAAVTGGLAVENIYKTATGELRIVV